jgi:hypothetical protein
MKLSMNRTPLLIHLIFHPQSFEARTFSTAVHRALNSDPLLPGLRVPTVMLGEDGTNFPPTRYDLNEAEHSIAVVFSDDYMVIHKSVPAGRSSWPDFVYGLAESCRANPKHRFLPVQLSSHGWPLHDKLRETNFIAAHIQPTAIRYRWFERRLMLELSRFLLGKAPGDAVPVKVFLSHAKHDITHEPKLFEAMATHLNACQPIEPWIDSGQIQPGTNFKDSIESAVQESAVVVLATAAYSSRPWCRREVLFAKKHCRPVVVVDGLQGVDVRSFPYIGNVPVISWSVDGAQQAIDLLLKEVVRIQHNKLVLNQQKQHNDVVLPAAPELVTLASLERGASVLYPDPPLSDEEDEALASLGIKLQTPLQRIGANKTLANRKIALSISESGDTTRFGLLPDQLGGAMIEMSRHLLVRGATLAYGGHLGDEGYTHVLATLIQAHQNLSTLPPVERILNYVGWPLPYETLPIEQQAKYSRLVTFVRIPRPEGVERFDPELFVAEPKYFSPDSSIKRFAWARGMSAMREQQSRDTDARIVIGGKTGPTMSAQPDGGIAAKWYAGRIPGVIEEAWFTILAGRPLYVCGAFGGAADLVVDLLEGRKNNDFTWDYQKHAPNAVETRQLYEREKLEWLDYPEITTELADFGVDGLARSNGLTAAQNRELFQTRDVSRMVALVMEGLSNKL